MNDKNTLAIIVPCFNEEAVIEETAKRLLSIINDLIQKNKISEDSGIYFVDDGSRDKTWNLIKKLNSNNSFFKGIKLSRNFGHQNAILAGLFNCNANAYITIDADLQDDVNAIYEMVDKYLDGFQIVYGVRKSRNTDSLFKKTTAQIYYKFLNLIGIKIIYNHSDFRLMSKKVMENLADYKEENIFLRGIIPQLGFDSCNVYYDRHIRFAGSTKYNLYKMLSFAWEGITSFSTFPLKLVTFLGFIFFIFSIILSFYSIYEKIIGNVIPGWTSIVVPVYFIGGIQLLSLGIIGEYIGKIYKEVKRRPRFIIEKIL